MRETASAIAAYFVDRGEFPASGVATGPERVYASHLFWEPEAPARIASGVATVNSFAAPRSGAARLVTFRVAERDASGALVGPATLTTPLAYMPEFLEDPFARTRGASLGYFAHGRGLGWILFSLGPDRDENAPGGPGQISPVVERLYNHASAFPGMWQPPPELIDATYDPTNGVGSRGDLHWMAGR
jgi:hypothetical protein